MHAAAAWFRPPQTDSLAPVPHTDLQKNPNSGFSAGLADDSNMFEWQVTIIGPPDTY
jgi:ubiquitin-conjugating enzyme E2 G1